MLTKQEILEVYISMIYAKIRETQKLPVQNLDANVLRALHDAVKEIRLSNI